VDRRPRALLRPDEQPVAARSGVIDDDGGSVALEIGGRDLQPLEVQARAADGELRGRSLQLEGGGS
jgi:hypothetical protein